MIRTLPETLEMVEGAGAKNGGIMIDLWHVVKLGIPYKDVARIHTTIAHFPDGNR
jgi:sugar phosphate isomerase/epimerase